MTPTNWSQHGKCAASRLVFFVIRFHPESSQSAKLAAVLGYCGIGVLLNVGANSVEHISVTRKPGYSGRIDSSESLLSAHARPTINALVDALWTVHSRAAIGDHDGEFVINVDGNNVSSSVLPMLDRHAKAAPESRYIGEGAVPMHALDTAVRAYLEDDFAIHLKIDTQGFEAAVLREAVQTIARYKTGRLELRLTPLYGGQDLWRRFLNDFKLRGFTLWTVLSGFVEASAGRTLQVNAILARA